MDSTYLPSISTLKRMSFERRSHPCSTKLQALVIPEKAQEKLPPHTSPQKEQMHTKTVFNHNKLCIYYAIRKSFTDSSLIVLSIQSLVTNCKGIAMEEFSQTMNVKEKCDTFSDLTWCSMRKETCTYNELGEFLMVSGYWKAHRTQHTEKMQRKKSLSPHNTHPKKQYRTTRQVWHYNTALVRTLDTIHKDELISRRSVLNTARLSARDSILMNCRRGLERGFFEGWAIQLNLQESQIHSPNPTPTKQLEACSELQWLLVKRLVTTLPGKTELLATSGD